MTSHEFHADHISLADFDIIVQAVGYLSEWDRAAISRRIGLDVLRIDSEFTALPPVGIDSLIKLHLEIHCSNSAECDCIANQTVEWVANVVLGTITLAPRISFRDAYPNAPDSDNVAEWSFYDTVRVREIELQRRTSQDELIALLAEYPRVFSATGNSGVLLKQRAGEHSEPVSARIVGMSY